MKINNLMFGQSGKCWVCNKEIKGDTYNIYANEEINEFGSYWAGNKRKIQRGCPRGYRKVVMVDFCSKRCVTVFLFNKKFGVV